MCEILSQCTSIFDQFLDTVIQLAASGVPRNFVRGGVQQVQLRKQDIEKGDLGAVAP